MMPQDPQQSRPGQQSVPYQYPGGQPQQYPPPQYQPQYPPPPQYVPQPQVQIHNINAQGGSRRSVSRNRMSFGVEIFHWFMILCTCGLWTPVYLSGKRKRKTVTSYR